MYQADHCLRDITKLNKEVKCFASHGTGPIFSIPKVLYHTCDWKGSSSMDEIIKMIKYLYQVMLSIIHNTESTKSIDCKYHISLIQ